VAEMRKAAAAAADHPTVPDDASPLSAEMQLLRPQNREESSVDNQEFRLPHELIEIFETPKHWRHSSRSLVS